MANLYLMEKLNTMVEINLPTLMMEHMTKMLNMTEGKHEFAYGYLLNIVFEYYGAHLSRGITRTMLVVFVSYHSCRG